MAAAGYSALTGLSSQEPTISPSSDATTVDLSTPDGIADVFVNHGVTLASAKGITDDDLESVYAEAYGHLAEGRAQEAMEDLMLLVTHDPWEPRFQFAYARSHSNCWASTKPPPSTTHRRC